MRFIYFIFISLSFLAAREDILLLSIYKKEDFKDRNLSHYLMSEKLDGVRGLWDGRALKTRSGRGIAVPEFFTRQLPPFALDGELWLGRGKFDELSSLVRSSLDEPVRQPGEDVKRWQEKWRKVSYEIFDVPAACEELKIQNCSLTKRLKILQNYLAKHPAAQLKIIPQHEVGSQARLEEFYGGIIRSGGEGVVLRRDEGSYERGRSKNALKLKPQQDAECRVEGYVPGEGEIAGQVGALLCRMMGPGEGVGQDPAGPRTAGPESGGVESGEIKEQGRLIKIGSGLSAALRKDPPKIGSIITYKFNGLTKNKLPRFPVFVRVRGEFDR